MNFFKKILKSIYSPSYYHDLMNVKAGESIKYFFALSATLSLISALVISGIVIPFVSDILANATDSVLETLPSEFVINIEEGKVITKNIVEPLFINIPNETGIKNIAVIDTITPFSVEKFKEYGANIWLSEESLWVMSEEGEIRGMPFDFDNQITLEKENIETGIEKVKDFSKYVYPISFVIIFILNFIYRLGFLIYLLIGAFFVILAAKVKGADVNYSKAYQLGIHGMTLYILLDFLLIKASIPFLCTILLFVVMLINLKKPAELVKVDN